VKNAFSLYFYRLSLSLRKLNQIKDMQTVRNKQRKKQNWQARNPELRDAVRYCVMMRLTEKESLDELSQRGHQISDRTFRRIKSDLEPNKQRLDKIIKQEFLLHAIRAVDTLESIKERLLEMRKNSQNTPEELKVLCEIRKTSREILDLYDASPVIGSLIEMEKKKRNDVEKST